MPQAAPSRTRIHVILLVFQSRVCVDLSITAIEEASMKLGENDFCCLADICELPFRDECFDGAISGYTIQHIAEHLQFVAIKEIFRVIKPNAHLCILTDVTYSVWHKGLFHCLMAARKLFEILHLIVPYTPAKVWKQENSALRIILFRSKSSVVEEHFNRSYEGVLD